MKIWIYINGQQEGPYTLEELLDKPVDENTKVWFEGLAKWYPAGALEQMRPLFDGSLTNPQHTESETAEPAEVETETDTTVVTVVDTEAEEPAAEEKPASKYAPGRRFSKQSLPDEPCPPTYIGWTVFLTICCCSPVSLAGLIASICVSSYYNSGRLRQARKASEVAAWLIMAAIALGMIPVMLMSALFGK